MKEYKKLWEVGSVPDFKDAFVDCVEGHYHAHSTGKVLHRDLSENNLMFDQVGDLTIGILNDWDIASSLDDNGEVSTSTARHHTGTIPFMAIDLLQSNPPAHLYRHDLESFFYILVWAAMNYDLKHKERCPIHRDIACWDSDLEQSRRSKFYFMMDVERSTALLSQVIPEFKGLVEEWIQPLWKMFYLGRIARNLAAFGQVQGYDPATDGGHITFHNFMKALGRAPRGLSTARVML
ncbi:hypothetical protein BDZ94DRAFT_1264619 [Collybia nuda]|uniref:Protein kinase domain-containing protein n=1 Tax=Collybia nuda TaxID=64659 RepID=A0A9P6CHN1_9AGAR|nr:hypothetical protein BDZ94DRAFT_1264619 [Collybia nuda]